MATQIRDTIKVLSPPWLQDGNAEKVLYDTGLGIDVELEKLFQAMTARMSRAPLGGGGCSRRKATTAMVATAAATAASRRWRRRRR